jgi:hypothetical protein
LIARESWNVRRKEITDPEGSVAGHFGGRGYWTL